MQSCDVTKSDNTSSYRNPDLVNAKDKDYSEPQPSTVQRPRRTRVKEPALDAQAAADVRALRERHGYVELDKPKEDLSTSEKGTPDTLAARLKARQRQPRKLLDF